MTGTSTPAARPKDKPLRADAARNRDKVLAAAIEVFGEAGTEASLEEIARRAGVGVGTLYRHFPNRAILTEAVYRRSVDEMAERARQLLSENSPRAALEQWVVEFVGYVARKHGMADALRAAAGEQSATVFVESRERLMAGVTSLLDAAQEEGTVRRDVAADDLVRAVSGICMAAAAADPERWRGPVRLVLDGLRFGADA